MSDSDRGAERRSDFIRDMVEADLASAKYAGRVGTRFPPEPNGYLHIGHAKSICLNFGCSPRIYEGGSLQPAIRRHQSVDRGSGVRRLRSRRTSAGSASTGRETLYYASDYFERLYEYAVELIEKGLAYVDSSSEEEIRRARAARSPIPVTNSSRSRAQRSRRTSTCLRRMRGGEFADGAHVLRARDGHGGTPT